MDYISSIDVLSIWLVNENIIGFIYIHLTGYDGIYNQPFMALGSRCVWTQGIPPIHGSFMGKKDDIAVDLGILYGKWYI